MEKEVPIICLVYLDNLLVNQNITMNSSTWRKAVFTSLIVASKIWDDESYENENFA